MSSPAERSVERAVCVYCASSRLAHPDYRAAARRLGEVLAGQGVGIVYGGGAVGSMGALADGAVSHGGRVIGILPRFMAELEWGHKRLTHLQLVEDLRTRKHMMLTLSQAAIALPGGSGTLEELLEAITLKRLGLYLNPIVLVNTRGFFTALIDMLNRAVEERLDRKSTRLNSSHDQISYAVFCLKKKKKDDIRLVFNPAHTPEFQPPDHLSPFLDYPLVNPSAATLNHLLDVVSNTCLRLSTRHHP